MNFNTITLALLLAASTAVSAQTGAASAPAAAPASPAKKALVQKVLKLQQPGVEQMATSLAEQPAAQLMQQAGQALQRVPPEQREAIAEGIKADVKKYVDDAVPVLRGKAAKLAPGVIGPILEQRFTEDELKQLVAWLESPVNRKFQQVAPEMQKALAEKLVADSRDVIEPKARALQAAMGQRFTPPAPAASAPAPKK